MFFHIIRLLILCPSLVPVIKLYECSLHNFTGIGRNFVSRMLLEAPVPGFQAGLDLLRMPNQVSF
jgi:hypothetical protein